MKPAILGPDGRPFPRKQAPTPERLISLLIPEEDRWALTPEGREKKLTQEAYRRKLMFEKLAEPHNGHLRKAFMQRCAGDVTFFARHMIWTQDPEGRMGLGTDLPYIPFQYTLRRLPLPPGYGDGRPIGGWLSSWQQALHHGDRVRLLHTKSRRARFSINASIANAWGLRNWVGWKSILGSDEEGAVDNAAGDWNSIMGKIRYIWDMCHRLAPWYYPALPALSKSPYNKQNYIKFPQEDDPAFAAFLMNEIAGVLPSEVAKRGGAALIAWIDEAAWVKKLKEFLETAGPMVRVLILGSTPSDDTNHSFQQIADGILDWPVDVVHWIMDPVLLGGLRWDAEGQHRGTWTQKWRSNFYAQTLREEESSAIARNYDINPTDTAAAPVFLGWSSDQVSSEDPAEQDYDLYDPEKPLWIYADIGWGDPWACWWVQTSDRTGEVNLVDFWMRAGVTGEWWLPLWHGWNPDSYHRGEVSVPGGAVSKWRNSPERLPWRQAVPHDYTEDDMEIMRYWHKRVNPQGIIIDASGKQHHGASRWSVVERLTEGYNCKVIPVSMAHHMEDMIAHSNMVMKRVRLSGRIAKRRPRSGGKVWPSALGTISNWRRLESTERGSPAKPLHDAHSHGGTALVYGFSQLPASVRQEGKPGKERSLGSRRLRGKMVTHRKPTEDPLLGY